jgi:hypothetical protein
MSDIASGANQSASLEAPEMHRSDARRLRRVLGEGQTPDQSADIVRRIVREAPLLALASAFLVGILIGRRR